MQEFCVRERALKQMMQSHMKLQYEKTNLMKLMNHNIKKTTTIYEPSGFEGLMEERDKVQEQEKRRKEDSQLEDRRN